jgi:ribosome assembly protein YihI (activator of Der GTPase)
VEEPDSDESTPGNMHNSRACLVLADDPVEGLGVSERVAKKHREVLKKDHNDVELEINSVDGEVRNDVPLLQEALEAGLRLRKEDAVVGELLRIVVEFLVPEHFG